MSQKDLSTKKKIILSAALTGLVTGIALTPDLASAHDHGDKAKKVQKKGEHKCADGSCGDKKRKKKGEHKCADGSCGDKKGKKKGEHKCGAGSCGDKK